MFALYSWGDDLCLKNSWNRYVCEVLKLMFFPQWCLEGCWWWDACSKTKLHRQLCTQISSFTHWDWLECSFLIFINGVKEVAIVWRALSRPGWRCLVICLNGHSASFLSWTYHISRAVGAKHVKPCLAGRAQVYPSTIGVRRYCVWGVPGYDKRFSLHW